MRPVPGTDDDLALIAPLWRAMVEHHRGVAGDDLPVRDADDAWAMRRQEYRTWLDDGSGTLLVAGSEQPDGYAFCRLVRSGPTFDFGQARGEVESLVVAPHARGGGVGTALLEACRRHLRSRGCTHWTVSVMAANDGAVQLYQRVGFRPWLLELAAPLDDEEPGDERAPFLLGTGQAGGHAPYLPADQVHGTSPGARTGDCTP